MKTAQWVTCIVHVVYGVCSIRVFCYLLQRLVSIYQSGKDISGEDDLLSLKTPKTPSTPFQPNGKCHSPSSNKHFNTLPHPPKKSKQLAKETSV